MRVRMSRALYAPSVAWALDGESKILRPNVGAIVFQEGSRMHGIAWVFSQIACGLGSERTLVRASSARELWERAQSFLDGFEYAKEERHDNR
jgi:hypothetical protein